MDWDTATAKANYCGPGIYEIYAQRPEHNTGNYVPYSLRTVSGFFNVPQSYLQGLWDGAYGLSSLSEKTRKSNHLQMSEQRQHFLLSYLFKDPEWWSGRGLNPRSPAR